MAKNYGIYLGRRIIKAKEIVNMVSVIAYIITITPQGTRITKYGRNK